MITLEMFEEWESNFVVIHPNCRCMMDFNSEPPETIIHVPKSDFTDLAIEAIIDHSLNS